MSETDILNCALEQVKKYLILAIRILDVVMRHF